MPSAYKAEDLAEAMKPLVRRGDKILLPRAKVARSVLPEMLTGYGCHVDVAEAYETVCDEENKEN